LADAGGGAIGKTYLGDAGGEPAQASHVSFVSLLHEGVDFIGEHPELRFHDSPHESTIDLRIAVDQDVAEGNSGCCGRQ
jgi:hypothetical protein